MNTRTLKKHLKYRIPEIKLAMIREREVDTVVVEKPADLHQFVEPLKHFSEEYFVSYHLTAGNRVIGYHVVSHGTLSASLVHPREVFKAALLGNSHAIIVAHNHPGGSLNPSDEDITTTKQLVEAGKILGVQVVDHLIVSITGVRSMRESFGYLFN